MELAGFGFYRYDLPFGEPVVSGGTTLQSRRGLLLKLAAEDGAEGWGEAAPLPGFSRETLDEAAGQLRDLSGLMLGSDVTADFTDPTRSPPLFPQSTELVPSVRFALELAMQNLSVSPTNSVLPKGGKDGSEGTVLINGLLSGSPERVLRDGLRMSDAGYRAVKLKVGGRDVAEDADLARKVRDAVGNGVELRLDANRAWDFEEAMEFGRGVADAGIGYVEEPLSEPERLAELARTWGLPVALDETLVGMESRKLGRHDYAQAVVLKPTLLGGISRTLRLVREASRLGMRSVISSSYESGVGTAGLVALAGVVGEEPAGLDTYRRLAADVIRDPLQLPAPEINVARAMLAAQNVDLGRLEPIPGL